MFIYLDAIVHPGASDAYFRGVQNALSPEIKVTKWSLFQRDRIGWTEILLTLKRDSNWTLLLSGSELNTTDRDDLRVKHYLENLKRVIELVEVNPTSRRMGGICFGHQAVAVALGGRTERKINRTGVVEVRPVNPSSHERRDSPSETLIQLYPVVHKDQVVEMPQGFRHTLCSDYCHIQGMRHERLPIETVQFHPEISGIVKDVDEEKDDWVDVDRNALDQHSGRIWLRRFAGLKS